MLDGTLFFVKSARYGKPEEDASSVFFFSHHRLTQFFLIKVFISRALAKDLGYIHLFLMIYLQTL